jgi:hypothetical protein
MKSLNFIGAFLIGTLFTNVNAQGQIPDFTRIDTGTVYNHISAHYAGAWLDIDMDSDMDLIIVNAGMYCRNKPNLLYRNERDGKFVRIDDDGYTKTPMFTACPGPFGDIDNDGDEDIILGGYDEPVNHIFKNDSFGNLEEIESFIVPNTIAVPFLLDINNNSFLDLIFIGNDGYVLYNDSMGSFHDPVSINIMEPEEEMLHGASWGDADNDGDMDLFCGYSYFNPEEEPGINALYINQGGGDFLKYNDSSGYFTDRAMTPSVNWIDYDNDNDMDLFVLNSWEYIDSASALSKLYINKGNLQFEKYIFEPGIYKDSHKNSSVWADIDNDGDLDLYITIEKNDFGVGGHESPTKFNLLFENQGNGLLTEISDHALANESSHGITFTDHDNDGDLDALLIRYSWSNNGHNTFFINEGNSNSWIILTCIGSYSNKSAFGTRITAKAIIGDSLVTQTREITPMHGHFTYPSTRVHFGLANAETIDTLIIRWPSGHIDEYLDVKSDQFYRAIEDEGLEIDFKATNFIRYNPAISDRTITEGESITIDLREHYQFVEGDTVPDIGGDTLTFSVYSVENPDAVTATVNGNILTLLAGTAGEISTVKLIASAGFTERIDSFKIEAGFLSIEDYQSVQGISIYPNPTKGVTSFRFYIPGSMQMTLEIYDLHGREVATLIDKKMPTGEHTLDFDLENLFPGIYLYRLTAGNQASIGKMVVAR